jgi:hypothetical protein
MLRRLAGWSAAALLLVLLAGHVVYQYGARERASEPVPGGLPARLLAAGGYDACAWIPYPHQNLGALSEAVGGGEEWFAAAARLADLPPPRWPSFGPFAVPPSREAVVCSDLDGERLAVAARVYPTVALVARLAGRVAGNPWLRGGEVREVDAREDGVRERVTRVEWRQGVWTVARGGDLALGAGSSTGDLEGAEGEHLARLRLARPVEDLPAGLYTLLRRGDSLEAELAGGGPLPEPPELPGGPPVLLAVAGPSWPPEEPRPLPPAALALFEVERGFRMGSVELPGAAVFHPPGEERWTLPAHGVVSLLSDRLPRGNAAGWRVVALDSRSLAKAEELAPGLAVVTPPDGDSRFGRLVVGVWMRPAPALVLVRRVREFLEKVPLVEQRQVRRWRDWETVLGPLAPCGRVSLVAVQDPASFRLALEDCRGD